MLQVAGVLFESDFGDTLAILTRLDRAVLTHPPRNVQRFRGGLVFKAHTYVSLNSMLERNTEENRRPTLRNTESKTTLDLERFNCI